MALRRASRSVFHFYKDTAPTEIYTLSLHDALPILCLLLRGRVATEQATACVSVIPTDKRRLSSGADASREDRKSTRLNSSHSQISYAVFCLKKTIIRTAFTIRSWSFTSRRSSPASR